MMARALGAHARGARRRRPRRRRSASRASRRRRSARSCCGSPRAPSACRPTRHGGSNTFQELMALASAFATSRSVALGEATIASDDDVRDGAEPSLRSRRSARRRRSRSRRSRTSSSARWSSSAATRAARPRACCGSCSASPLTRTAAIRRDARLCRRGALPRLVGEIRVRVRCDAVPPSAAVAALLAIMPVRRRARRVAAAATAPRALRGSTAPRAADAQTSALLSEPLSAPSRATDRDRRTRRETLVRGRCAAARARAPGDPRRGGDARDETDGVAVATVPTTFKRRWPRAREQQRRADVGRRQAARSAARGMRALSFPARATTRARRRTTTTWTGLDEDDDDEYVTTTTTASAIRLRERAQRYVTDEEAVTRSTSAARGGCIMFRWDPPIGWFGATIKRQAKNSERRGTPHVGESLLADRERRRRREHGRRAPQGGVRRRPQMVRGAPVAQGQRKHGSRGDEQSEEDDARRRLRGRRPGGRAERALRCYAARARASSGQRRRPRYSESVSRAATRLLRPSRMPSGIYRSSCVAVGATTEAPTAPATGRGHRSPRPRPTGSPSSSERALKYGVCLEALRPDRATRSIGLFKVRWEEDGDTGTLVAVTEERQRCCVTIGELGRRVGPGLCASRRTRPLPGRRQLPPQPRRLRAAPRGAEGAESPPGGASPKSSPAVQAAQSRRAPRPASDRSIWHRSCRRGAAPAGRSASPTRARARRRCPVPRTRMLGK